MRRKGENPLPLQRQLPSLCAMTSRGAGAEMGITAGTLTLVGVPALAPRGLTPVEIEGAADTRKCRRAVVAWRMTLTIGD